MNPTDLEPLIRDLVAWVSKAPRPYGEVMERWRTSCPQLPVWEEASDRKFVERKRDENGTAVIVATAQGVAFLKLC